MSVERSGPLAGLRIVDLTQMLSGPYCTMLLADLGSDVVKVEPPRGDATRYVGPYREDDELRSYGGYFQSVNRNKRSICADLKKDEGKEIVRKLVRNAHAVVENFSPGVMERLGLSYEELRKLNPRLVYASIRGFGDQRTGESPYVDWPAFDVTAQAMGGFMGITGEAGEPMKSGPGIGDIFPASLCALGIVAAVRNADQTGKGQYVDVAMYDGILALCERIVYQYSYNGEVPAPQGNTHPLLCPFDVFNTKDGAVSVAAPSDVHWRVLCEIMGAPEFGTDERYKTNFERSAHGDEVRKIVGDWTSQLTNDEVLDALGSRVPVAPINNVKDIFEDPHTKVREMLVEVEQPGSSRPVVIAGVPIKLTETPGGVLTRAPLLGEHTDQVLAELGLTTQQVVELRAAEVVK